LFKVSIVNYLIRISNKGRPRPITSDTYIFCKYNFLNNPSLRLINTTYSIKFMSEKYETGQLVPNCLARYRWIGHIEDTRCRSAHNSHISEFNEKERFPSHPNCNTHEHGYWIYD
jgi:hypothetical protein